MLFSSLTFIFLFLPIVLVVYYISPKKLRNLVLFLSSLVFYSWGEPVYIVIMLFSIVFNYLSGLLIGRAQEDPARKKLILVVSIVGNLSVLGFFKYSNFFIENINSLFGAGLSLVRVALPIGISFYTFQSMSYTIDVYRGQVLPNKNIINFGTYVTLFPQLVAGPIVRYKDIARELDYREEDFNKFAYGVRRFIVGFAKKILLANSIGQVWNQVSQMELASLPILTAWLAALAFSLQIYFDFSGYSDMAIGLGYIFGFSFLENFDYPYISRSLTEFWRRWHISLSSWFKEYVYIPLGGSRCSRTRLIINLFIVWTLTGFWHGASWNFLIWGFYFGLILTLEKLLLLDYLERLPAFFQHIYALFFIVVGWVIFALEDLSQVIAYLRTMFGLNGNLALDSGSLYLLRNNLVVLVLACLASTRLGPKLKERLLATNKDSRLLGLVNLAYLLIFIVSICFLIGDSYNPFLYFRF